MRDDWPLAGSAAVRYFSLARHALVAGLRTLGLREGARVLLPEYICRDLLASLHSIGAEALYYPVSPDLAPATPSDEWPTAAAVLMVDYFGFAQDPAPFERYRRRTGALLIEDNAHGFLSRDDSGRWLGRRGDAGLFSLRKTFWLDNGGALVLESDHFSAPVQLEEMEAIGHKGARIRRTLNTLPGGRMLTGFGAVAVRALRKLRTGHAIAPPAADAEIRIPQPANPFRGLSAMLVSMDATAEAARRRRLYLDLEPRARAVGAIPVFSRLPPSTVPYGLPVYCDDAAALVRMAASAHLDCFRWPDLPDALAARAPDHYRRLHVVNFL